MLTKLSNFDLLGFLGLLGIVVASGVLLGMFVGGCAELRKMTGASDTDTSDFWQRKERWSGGGP